MKLFPFKLGRIGKTNVGVVAVSLLGIYGFVLAKKDVDQNRYENMKVRQRMIQSNTGDYDSSPRFK
jgi:hypothetical protein